MEGVEKLAWQNAKVNVDFVTNLRECTRQKSTTKLLYDQCTRADVNSRIWSISRIRMHRTK